MWWLWVTTIIPNDGFPYGLVYRGDVTGNGAYTKIHPASLVTLQEEVKYTIAHSNINGVVVGNFATTDAAGLSGGNGHFGQYRLP